MFYFKIAIYIYQKRMDENEMTAVVTCWKKTFKTATDFDVWGQRVEAVDMYKR